MVQDGGGLSKEGLQAEEAWMIEAERAAGSGKTETETTVFREIKHERGEKWGKLIKKPGEGLKKVKENVKDKDKQKLYGKRLVAAILGIIGGVSGYHFELVKRLSEKWDAVSEKIPGVIGHPEKIQGLTPDQAVEAHLSNLEIDYARFGMGGGLNIEALTDPEHAHNESVIYMTAKVDGGGPNWLFAFDVNDQGESIKGYASDAAFNGLVEKLNLSSTEQQDLRAHWSELHNNSAYALQWLSSHRADPAVVKFYQCTIDVYNKDLDKTTWQDRIPGVQACSTQATSALTGEIKDGLPGVAKVKWVNEVKVQGDSYFNELVARVDAETGGVVGQILGPLETLGNMPIDTTAMHEAAAVDMAEFYQHESQKPLLANTGLPLVLTGLFLLRVGPSWPKEIIAKASQRLEDVYYWFKLGQPERAMRNLTVLGQQAWERVTGKKD